MLRIILLSLLSVLWFSPDAFSQKASVSGEVFCGKMDFDSGLDH